MFECTRCANRHSPLCELCTQVTSPDGTKHKPKYYVEFTGVNGRYAGCKPNRPFNSERGEECAKMLERYLSEGSPLPVALVMEYNKFAK